MVVSVAGGSDGILIPVFALNLYMAAMHPEIVN
jgi:hypothetical protein